MPQQGEFGELGDFFKTLIARLLSHGHLAGQRALESGIDLLGDAVAIFNPDGQLLFANPMMRAALPLEPLARPVDDFLPPGHPYRRAIEETLASRQSRGPLSACVPDVEPDGAGEGRTPSAREQLILTHVIEDADRHLVAVMLAARNVDHLSQGEPAMSYARKLAAFSRLSAGLTHEVRNPLNATVIHLELLRQRLTSSDAPAALEHLAVITAQMRRLDQVVQGFLTFIGPEDLKLRPVSLALLIDELMPVFSSEAQKYGVEVDVEIPPALPDISADASMIQQALLNLALNACQAMPHGGRLRIAGAAVPGKCVEVLFEDTGVGIAAEHVDKIFNLYFTTKPHGAGIGLSLVYRTVQLHEGEIEVQSTPGRGTTFRMLLPQA